MKYIDKSIVNVTKNVVSCELDGEIVLLNHDKGIYFGLDKVGAYIWNLIQKPKSIKEIKTMVLKEYDVQPQKCDEDVEQFLKETIAAGIISVHNP